MIKREQIVVAACADTMFPPNGPIAVSGTEAELVSYVDAYIRALPRMQRFLVHMLFLFIQLSPLVFGPRHSRFSRLSQHERLMVFRDMEVSSIYFRRIAFLSMRAIMTFGYFACKRVDAVIMRQESERVDVTIMRQEEDEVTS